MLRSFRIAICIAIVLVFVGVSVSQSHNVKTYGPSATAQFFRTGDDGYNTFGQIQVSMEGSQKDAQTHLIYIYQRGDWNGHSRYEDFDGIIPNSCLTWSGTPEFNGGFTVTLIVDTTSMTGTSKHGTGGSINITLTPKPLADVYRYTGPTSTENATTITKQTGTVNYMYPEFSGWYFDRPIVPTDGDWAFLNFYNLTTISQTKK